MIFLNSGDIISLEYLQPSSRVGYKLFGGQPRWLPIRLLQILLNFNIFFQYIYIAEPQDNNKADSTFNVPR